MPIFKTPGPITLTVSVVYAEVTVTAGQGGHDTDSTTIEVTPKDPSNRKDVDEAKSIALEQPSPTEIFITAPPASWLSFLNRGTAVIHVVCPRDSKMVITNRKGDIKILGDVTSVRTDSGHGALDLSKAVVAEEVYGRTSNGPITVADSRKLDVHTRNGNIDVKHARTEAYLKTNNGSIKAKRVEGDLVAHTANGAVEIEYAGSAVDASSNNGTIRLSHVVKGTVVGKTNNGKVFCGVAQPANVTSLETRTLSGSVHDSLGDRSGSGEDISIELRTNAGDISVSRSAPPAAPAARTTPAAGPSTGPSAGPSSHAVTEEQDWGPVPDTPSLPDNLPPRYNQEWRAGESAPPGEGKPGM